MKTPEELLHLAKTDPDALEAYKRSEIALIIGAAPEHRRDRLKGLQWSIDSKLSVCKDDVQRYNKMVELFWEGFTEFKGAVNMFEGELTSIDTKLDK